MSMEDGNAIETKPRGNLFHQPLANARHPDAARRFALDRGHGDPIPITAHVAERFEIGVGVEHKPEGRDVVANGDADMCHAAAIDSHTRMISVYRGGEIVIAEQFDEGFLEFADVTGNSEPDGIKRKNRIAGHLAWQVKHRAATAANPAHGPAPRLQLFGTGADMRSAPLATDANTWRMIAQDE
jgi:hypothetical protein